MPQTLSILTAVFPRDERSKALGIWAGALGLGTAGGPLVGGVLVDQVGWAAVFWVPVPIVVLTLLGLRIVPESRSGGDARLDLPGAVLGTGGLIALVYGIIEGQNAGWGSAPIVGAFVVAATALVAFIAVERLAPSPMMPLRFFRQRDFNGSVVVYFFIFFAFLGLMFFLAQFLQLVQGKSAFTTGLQMMPTAAGIMVVGPIAGRLIPLVGPKLLVMTAMGIATGVLVWFTRLEPDTAYWSTGLALGLFGIAGGIVMPTLTDTTMAAVPLTEAGRASGVGTMGRQMGGAVGIAVLGTIAATSYASGVGDALTGVLSASVVEQIQDGIGGASAIARNADPELRQVIEAAAFPAFVDAVTDVFTICAVVMALAGVAALFLLPLRMRASQMSEARAPSAAAATPPPNPRRAAEPRLRAARPPEDS